MPGTERDLKTALAAIASEQLAARGDHPAVEHLTDYHYGRLSAVEEVVLKEHLALCRDCVALLRDCAGFEDLADTEGQRIPTDKLRESLRARLGIRREVAGARRRWSEAWWCSPRLARAAAAVLLAVSVVLTASLIVARRQNDRSAALVAELRGSLASLRLPQLNPPSVDLSPRGLLRAEPRDSPPVVLPEGSEMFVLTLNVADPEEYPGYRLQILAGDGEEVWVGDGLERTRFGNFRVVLTRHLLPSGDYRLKLFGLRDEEAALIGEFPVSVRTR